MPRNSSTWLDVVRPDVIDVVARPLVGLRPVGEALEELVGLLRYQLETGVVLLLVLLVRLQRTARSVNVRPTLKSEGTWYIFSVMIRHSSFLLLSRIAK